MLKVIDLDHQGKDADGYVFVLTIGNERIGITDQEVTEVIKAKYTASKSTKRVPQRKAAVSESAQNESSNEQTSLENDRIDSTSDLTSEASH